MRSDETDRDRSERTDNLQQILRYVVDAAAEDAVIVVPTPERMAIREEMRRRAIWIPPNIANPYYSPRGPGWKIQGGL